MQVVTGYGYDIHDCVAVDNYEKDVGMGLCCVHAIPTLVFLLFWHSIPTPFKFLFSCFCSFYTFAIILIK